MEIDSNIIHHWKDQQPVSLAVKISAASDNQSNVPGLIWLGGFKSDMTGTKACAMVETAAELNTSSLRFDYSGHGRSGGQFIDGTISRWVDESLQVLREKTVGPQVLVGSSMGGWIALRMVQELNKVEEMNRVAGLILIAPAPDFTATLMEPQFSDKQRSLLQEQGYIEEASEYSDEPNIITKTLIDDGRNNLVLNSDLKLNCPVSILQGMQDPDVPHSHAQLLMEALPHDDVALNLIPGGDHRLSRDEDIALLQRTIRDFFQN